MDGWVSANDHRSGISFNQNTPPNKEMVIAASATGELWAFPVWDPGFHRRFDTLEFDGMVGWNVTVLDPEMFQHADTVVAALGDAQYFQEEDLGIDELLVVTQNPSWVRRRSQRVWPERRPALEGVGNESDSTGDDSDDDDSPDDDSRDGESNTHHLPPHEDHGTGQYGSSASEQPTASLFQSEPVPFDIKIHMSGYRPYLREPYPPWRDLRLPRWRFEVLLLHSFSDHIALVDFKHDTRSMQVHRNLLKQEIQVSITIS